MEQQLLQNTKKVLQVRTPLHTVHTVHTVHSQSSKVLPSMIRVINTISGYLVVLVFSRQQKECNVLLQPEGGAQVLRDISIQTFYFIIVHKKQEALELTAPARYWVILLWREYYSTSCVSCICIQKVLQDVCSAVASLMKLSLIMWIKTCFSSFLILSSEIYQTPPSHLHLRCAMDHWSETGDAFRCPRKLGTQTGCTISWGNS